MGSDCTSSVCKTNICQCKNSSFFLFRVDLFCILAPTCSDGVKNQDETDVDCGGSACPKCAVSKVCKIAADCSSSVCKSNICQGKSSISWTFPNNSLIISAPTCSDGVLNQDETDTDCGGPKCLKCAVSKICKVGADCNSGVCTLNICQGNNSVSYNFEISHCLFQLQLALITLKIKMKQILIVVV